MHIEYKRFKFHSNKSDIAQSGVLQLNPLSGLKSTVEKILNISIISLYKIINFVIQCDFPTIHVPFPYCIGRSEFQNRWIIYSLTTNSTVLSSKQILYTPQPAPS